MADAATESVEVEMRAAAPGQVPVQPQTYPARIGLETATRPRQR